MTAPPARNTLSGTPTNAQFNAGIGALYDYTVGLLGAAGTPAAARAALDAVGLTGNETIAGVKTFTGNVGIGLTPNAWGTNVRAMEVSGAAISRNDSVDAKLVLSNNVYRDNGHQWFYMTTGFAAAMYQQGFGVGDHQWYVAGTGNANTQVSFTQAMTLTANGNLLVGGTFESAGRLVDLVSTTKTHLSLTHPGLVTWGIAINADASLAFNNGTERLRIDNSGNVTTTGNITAGGQFIGNGAGLTNVSASAIATALNASGSAPIYACRAWVNFNGTGTVAIRASGNVSSITDNGVGDYTVNFTTAMPDADYAATGLCRRADANDICMQLSHSAAQTTSSVRITTKASTANINIDTDQVHVAIFR